MRQSKGFTLVELAIALMVIGLLIGGVLKGQELIENARVTQMIRHIKAYETAVTIFRNSYNALPGDFKHPTRIPNCSEAPCNVAGDGDGRLLQSPTRDRINYWRHMERAGLISGMNEEGDHRSASPLNPFDGYLSVRWVLASALHNSSDKHRYYISDGSDTGWQRIRFMRAMTLDQKMDDGKPLSGTVMISPNSATCYDEDANDYVEVNSVPTCIVWVDADGLN